MSTDYIYAWPNNPVELDKEDMADRMIEELTPIIRSYLADELPEALLGAIEEAMKHDYAPPNGWEDCYDQQHQTIKDYLYDVLYVELKKMWED